MFQIVAQAPAQMPLLVGQALFAGGIILLLVVLWRFSKIE